jgi:hypothetical protein
MGIYVVRAFVQLRGVAVANKELARELNELERRVDSHETVIVRLMKPFDVAHCGFKLITIKQ